MLVTSQACDSSYDSHSPCSEQTGSSNSSKNKYYLIVSYHFMAPIDLIQLCRSQLLYSSQYAIHILEWWLVLQLQFFGLWKVFAFQMIFFVVFNHENDHFQALYMMELLLEVTPCFFLSSLDFIIVKSKQSSMSGRCVQYLALRISSNFE